MTKKAQALLEKLAISTHTLLRARKIANKEIANLETHLGNLHDAELHNLPETKQLASKMFQKITKRTQQRNVFQGAIKARIHE